MTEEVLDKIAREIEAKRNQFLDEEIMEALYELAKERAAAADVDIIDVKVSDRELQERILDRRLRWATSRGF